LLQGKLCKRGLSRGCSAADRYQILDVPDDLRVFSSKLIDRKENHPFFDKSRLQSDSAWVPGTKFQEHGPDEYIVLNAGAPRLIGGVVISGCGCCSAHASQVRLSVSLHDRVHEAKTWTECGDHDCCGDHVKDRHNYEPCRYDLLEIEPIVAQFVKINPREWRNMQQCDVRC